MKRVILLAVACSALVIGASASFANINKNAEERDATIIVKMKTNVDNYSEAALINKQNALLAEISSNVTSNYKIKNRYSHIFNGFVLEIPSAYVAEVSNLSAVADVNYQNIVAQTTSFDDGFKYVINFNEKTIGKTASAQTMEKPSGTKEGSGTFIAILDNAFYIGYDENNNEFHHNVFSPLNDEDVFVTQASLKELIDASQTFHGRYNEQNSTYFSNKVPFYYDYGGDSSSGTTPDYVVYAEGFDHGTHVASIAGGNAGDEYEGIAPHSQMALMKVFRTYMSGSNYVSGAPNDAILNALEDCVILGVDAINMSLGSNLNDFDGNSILESTIKTLSEKGTFVDVAAGNSGKGQYSGTVYRYWDTDMLETGILSSHANNLAAMTVASSQADFQFYGEAITVDGHNIQYSDQVTNYNSVDGPVTYEPERYLTDLTKDGQTEFDFVFVPNVGKEEDFEGLDVSGKIAIIERGDITFKEKVDNSVAHGAIAVGIIDNTTASEFNIRMSFGDNYNPAVPVVFILSKDKTVFESSTTNKIKFLINVDLENPNARTISDYSSDGARYDLSIKPEISTPGENIKGAVLGGVDKYESMSGTSMATPNMTGAHALMISEHLNDANYRKTINARVMSTAHPMKDNTVDHNHTSVRMQGAGLVNLDGALNSKVYLDGIDANGNQIGKAKVELFNNEKIANGNVDLKFAAINESESAITYTATTYVYAPSVDQLGSIFEEFADVNFQTVNDQLVQKFTDTVTINPGKNTIDLPAHQIDDAKLQALKGDFKNGCVLEGYVILTADAQYQLSIPFLGFYGDMEKVPAVEEFDFDRAEGDVKTSDFLNYLISKSISGFEKANYTSSIYAGYWADPSKISYSDVLKNASNISLFKDQNGNSVNHVGFNPYTGKINDDGKLYVANNSYVNTLIIQQYVKRSVADNSIVIKNKATGEVVRTHHMMDMLMGGSYDAETQTYEYPLWKSHFNDSYYDEGYMADRAYATLTLTDDNNKPLPDGEYEITFSYDILAGGTYSFSKTLVISSQLPTIASVEELDNSYRIHYNDTSLTSVAIGNKQYEIKTDAQGVYVEILKSEVSGPSIIEVQNLTFSKEKFMTHLDDPKGILVSHNMLLNNPGYDFKVTVEENAANDLVYTFAYQKNGKDVSLSGNVIIRIQIPEGIDIETAKLYSVAANGKERDMSFEVVNDYIHIASSLKKFHLVSDAKVTPLAEYTVSFNANGGIGQMSDVKVTEGNKYTLPANGFVAPEGKEFDGWTVNGVQYAVGAEIDINADTVISAKWKDAVVPGPSSSSQPDSSSSSQASSESAPVSSTSASEPSSAPESSKPSSSSTPTTVSVGCGGQIAGTVALMALVAFGLVSILVATSLMSKKKDE